MDINQKLCSELNIKDWQAKAVIDLIDEGNTIPFIARYRKEATGAMDDEKLRNFNARLKYLRALEERKQTILNSIEEQGKLSDELRDKIEAAETSVILEDLYRPYKPKRRTRAMIAREKGLGELAEYIMNKRAKNVPLIEAEKYINSEKDVNSADDAIKYALDIIAEEISDDADTRAWIRKLTSDEGVLISTATKDAKAKAEAGEHTPYENYYEYAEAVSKIPGHRILAINRGEAEGMLTVKVEAPKDRILSHVSHGISHGNKITQSYIDTATADAYKRLIAPSVENEIRNELKDKAEDGAIKVFGSNLEQLLMQPPLSGHTVLGWDPAFRTGCKLAVVDPTGKILDTAVIFPTAPQNKVAEAKKVVEKLCLNHKIDVISIGNGTASRESEKIIAEFILEFKKAHPDAPKIQYIIVNEAGASVYSASELATKEYPNLDVGERSSASIARRLQDPLAELVKIDPKSIGVGQYQHDMDQKKLGEALGSVVEDCVNKVGVDLNTASPSLLSFVSGINSTIASNIVNFREANGRFKNRKQLLKVPKLGPKAFEQCAGFLRISGGDEPLDCTAVHPESYDAARQILNALGYSPSDLKSGGIKGLSSHMKLQEKSANKIKVGVGTFTLKDILSELEKPGRDPREEAQAPILRSDVLDMNDLKPGMSLKGTVRNIVDFGAFVDIGVHQDGLVHISEMADHYVKHPLDVVKVGDIVDVKVLSVDQKRGKISLTMKK